MEREDLYEPLHWKNEIGRTVKARKQNKIKPKNHAVVVQVPSKGGMSHS